MKKHSIAALGLLMSLNIITSTSYGAEGPGDVGSVVFNNQMISGYKCSLKKGSLNFDQGERSQAFKSFYDLNSISIFNEKTLLSGQLKNIEGKADLEFQTEKTLTLASFKSDQSDRQYTTAQNTIVMDTNGNQIKSSEQLPEGSFLVKYEHVFEQIKNEQKQKLVVTIIEEQTAGSTEVKNARFEYDYQLIMNPMPDHLKHLNGKVTGVLDCSNR